MAAYYNEFDPQAAAWLRELIKRGLIAPGDVDNRSILEVSPDDVKGYTQCHWFAGIGVWSHALRQAGWPDDREVWTGSPPCQPFSAAGIGLGVEDERHLWPAFFNLIRVRRPAVFFGEQVSSSLAVGKTASEDVQNLWRSREYLTVLENRLFRRISTGLQILPECSGAGMGQHAPVGHLIAGEQGHSVGESAFSGQGFALRFDDDLAGRNPSEGGLPSDRDCLRSSGTEGVEHAFTGSPTPGGGLYDEQYASRLVCVECGLWSVGRESDAGGGGCSACAARLAVQHALQSNAEQIAEANGYSWLNALQSDMEGAEYAFGAFDLCAAGFGAPHIRQRLYLCGTRALADTAGGNLRPGLRHSGSSGLRGPLVADHGPTGWLGHGIGAGLEEHAGHGDGEGRWPFPSRSTAAAGQSCGLPDANDALWRPDGSGGYFDDRADAGRTQGAGHIGSGGEVDRLDDGGWTGPTNGFWGFADWLLCRDGKWRPVEPGTFPLAHGAAARVGRLRGYGNAIVAEVAEGFIRSYLEAESEDFDRAGAVVVIDGDFFDLLG